MRARRHPSASLACHALVLAIACVVVVTAAVAQPDDEASTRLTALWRLADTDPAAAAAAGVETVAFARQHHHVDLEIDGLLATAVAHHRLGRLIDGLDAATEARATAERAGDRHTHLHAEAVWARIAADRGDFAGAIATLLPAVAQAERTVPAAVRPLLAAHARVAAQMGDHVLARELAARAGSPSLGGEPSGATAADLHLSLGLAALAADEPDTARKAYVTALDLLEASPAAGAALARLGLGNAHAREGRLPEAQDEYVAGLALAVRLGDQLTEARLHHAVARLAQQTGETIVADARLETALSLSTAADANADVASITWALFDLRAARGQTGPALEFLRQHGDAYRAVAGRDAMRRLLAAERGDANLRLRATRDAAARAKARVVLLQRILIATSLLALALAGVLWQARRVRVRRQQTTGTATPTSVDARRTADALLLMCATCRRVRSDEGEWTIVETWLRRHVDRPVTHGVCPDCEQRLLTAATADPDLLRLLGAEPPRPVRRAQGGFDWPPSGDELARVVRADTRMHRADAGPENSW